MLYICNSGQFRTCINDLLVTNNHSKRHCGHSVIFGALRVLVDAVVLKLLRQWCCLRQRVNIQADYICAQICNRVQFLYCVCCTRHKLQNGHSTFLGDFLFDFFNWLRFDRDILLRHLRGRSVYLNVGNLWEDGFYLLFRNCWLHFYSQWWILLWLLGKQINWQ